MPQLSIAVRAIQLTGDFLKTHHQILLISLFLFLSCFNRTSLYNYKKPYIVKKDDLQLLTAFNIKNDLYIDRYFKYWEESITPVTEDELISYNDTLKSIYQVFFDFYQLDTVYLNYDYLVLQNDIEYCIVKNEIYKIYGESLGSLDSLDSFLDFKKIMNFRPRVSFQEIKLLYLDQKHFNTLNYFFNEENGNYSYINKFNKKRNRNKEIYLSKKIRISKQHWFEGHHYYSFPKIYSMAFNNDLSRVKISYRYSWFVSAGVEYEYSHKETKWIKVKSLQIGGVE